jgi:3',5'-nucleoside bisphosphate phosphatase
MILAVDLHIHSCLSPCADDDMTPNNIAAMAHLKGLAAISVCDHNSCLNSAACAEACKTFGLTFLPGVEVTTQEEIHALCYFPTMAQLQKFSAIHDGLQPHFINRPELFGNQIVMDEADKVIGECDRMLYQAIPLSLEQLEQDALRMGGVMVPSHIDRQSNSLLSNLGFIPPGLKARVMEVTGNYELPAGYSPLRSSDAHCLERILEGGFPIDTAGNTAADIVFALKKGWDNPHFNTF